MPNAISNLSTCNSLPPQIFMLLVKKHNYQKDNIYFFTQFKITRLHSLQTMII